MSCNAGSLSSIRSASPGQSPVHGYSDEGNHLGKAVILVDPYLAKVKNRNPGSKPFAEENFQAGVLMRVAK